MTDSIIDLSKPTGHFEVTVWHHPDGLHAVSAGSYSVDIDSGLGRCTVYQTPARDKALGVAEYLEETGRISRGGDGEFITNEGATFTGDICED